MGALLFQGALEGKSKEESEIHAIVRIQKRVQRDLNIKFAK